MRRLAVTLVLVLILTVPHGVQLPAAVAATGPTLSATRVANFSATRGPFAEMAALQGEDAIVHVHEWGDIGAFRSDGSALWSYSGIALYKAWGLNVPVTGTPPQATHHTQRFAHGIAFATGDINGDGVADVAVAYEMYLQFLPQNGFIVSVFDGRDGSILAQKLFSAPVDEVAISDGSVIAFDQSGGFASFGARSWSSDIGASGVEWAGGIASIGGLVTSWQSNGVSNIVAIDPATGAIRWSDAMNGDAQWIRADTARGTIAAVIEDPTGPQWSVSSLDPATGATLATSPTNAGTGPTAFVLADVTGDGKPEWVASEDIQYNDDEVTSWGLVGVFDADAGTRLWAHALVVDQWTGEKQLVVPFDVAVANGRVIVSSILDFWGTDGDVPTSTQVRAFDGLTGTPAWTAAGDDSGVPRSLVVLDGRLYTMTAHQDFRAYDVATGALLLDSPILSDIYAVVALDINGDGTKDLLVGGASSGVFALDGKTLNDPAPRLLWSTSLLAGVHELKLADTDGDGKTDLVAATLGGAAVLDPISGAKRFEVALPGDAKSWSLALADVRGAGGNDIIIAGHDVRAFSGVDGAPLWTFSPTIPAVSVANFANVVATPGGRLVTQFSTSWTTLPGSIAQGLDASIAIAAGAPQAPTVVGLDARSGALLWSKAMSATTDQIPLWRSVASGASFPIGDGEAVAVASFPTTTVGATSVQMLDARSGTALAAAWTDPGSERFWGMETLSTGEVVVTTESHIARLFPSGALRLATGVMPMNMAVVDLGAQGQILATTASVNTCVIATPRSSLDSGGAWTGFGCGHLYGWPRLQGAMIGADLDGDGVQELITFAPDNEAQDIALAEQGLSPACCLDAYSHGLNVYAMSYA